MSHPLSTWLAAAAFLAAGIINIIGSPATRRDFVCWGYPAWWRHVTGGLEVAVAILIVLSPTHLAGLILGAPVIAAAVVTVLRHRDLPHLVPLGAFAAVLAFAAFAELASSERFAQDDVI